MRSMSNFARSQAARMHTGFVLLGLLVFAPLRHGPESRMTLQMLAQFPAIARSLAASG